jgi:hypothetical protein
MTWPAVSAVYVRGSTRNSRQHVDAPGSSAQQRKACSSSSSSSNDEPSRRARSKALAAVADHRTAARQIGRAARRRRRVRGGTALYVASRVDACGRLRRLRLGDPVTMKIATVLRTLPVRIPNAAHVLVDLVP